MNCLVATGTPRRWKKLTTWWPYCSHSMCVQSPFSHVRLFATLWTVARQAPLSMGFSRQEYWSGLPHPPPWVHNKLPQVWEMASRKWEQIDPGTEDCVLSHFSRVQLFVTLWTVAHQAPLSMGFSRQEYWSENSFPSPGDLPHPGIEPASFTSPALSGGFFTTRVSWEAWN